MIWTTLASKPKAESQHSFIEWNIILEAARPRPDTQRLGELLNRCPDWTRLLALAEQHSLLPLLTQRALPISEQRVSAEFRESLQEQQRSHTIFALRLVAELLRVLDRLAAAGVEAVVIKGPALSTRCYGDPCLRQYSDLDLIVRTQDIGRCTEIMQKLGYEARIPGQAIRAGKIPGEYAFRQASTHLLVEFHTQHTFRYYPRRFPIERLFERKSGVCVAGREIPALSVEDELILICIHGAKHLWERLAWVADVAALSTGTVDWQYAFAAAQDSGAKRMLWIALHLAMDMLGPPIPAEVAKCVTDDTGAIQLAKQIARWLPHGEAENLGVFGRGLYRMRMREAAFPGLAYLLRLTFSPTEADWSPTTQSGRSRAWEAIGRPLRLVRKYRHES